MYNFCINNVLYRERMTVDGCLSHPWIKNMESQGGVINRERLSEFQAQYKLRVGVNYILYITGCLI